MKNSNYIRVYTTLLSCFYVALSLAQVTHKPCPVAFGIKAGADFSNLYDHEATESNVLSSFNAGLFATVALNKTFALQPEVYYTVKGSELTYDSVSVMGKARYQLQYVVFPLVLITHLSDHFDFQLGPYASYLINAKVTNESNPLTFDFENHSTTADYNRYDLGVLAGIGLHVDSLGFGIRYNYGLTTIGKEKNYDSGPRTLPNAKNSGIQLYLSYSFN